DPRGDPATAGRPVQPAARRRSSAQRASCVADAALRRGGRRDFRRRRDGDRGRPEKPPVTVGPRDEAPRRPEGDGFSDAVTFAFGDERAGLYGVARVGLSGESATGLAMVFHGGRPVSVAAEGGVEVPEEP